MSRAVVGTPDNQDARKRRSPCRRPFLRFRRSQDGASAVEFALVALPFFMLLFAIIEVGMVFFGNQVLDNGVAQAARMIRTGQAQMNGFDEQAFRQEVCNRIDALFACDEALSIDVRTIRSFGDADLSKPITGDPGEEELDNSGFGYDPGSGGEIVVVRVFYEWNTFTPSFGVERGTLGNGKRVVSSTMTFRNEPF